jgi:hypothetical protein
MSYRKNFGCSKQCHILDGDVIKLADQKLASISSEDWQRGGEHARNTQQQLIAQEGILIAEQEFEFHVSSDNDNSSDDSSYSSGGDEEEQACGDDICGDIAMVVPLQ